jgi:hypothetical protein
MNQKENVTICRTKFATGQGIVLVLANQIYPYMENQHYVKAQCFAHYI